MLDKKQPDGATLRQHLEMAYQASGIKPEQLEREIELPVRTEHIWGYFVDLHNERTSNGMGPNKITSTAIKDWCIVTRTRLEYWEVMAIKHLDNLWMRSLNDD